MSDIKQESASVMTAVEPEQTSSFPEFEIRELERQKSTKTIRMVESARLGLTVLALLSAIVIVGTSAETLGVYNRTHLGQDYFLALWPTNFDIRPTIALITCGAIIVLASAISLATSKVPAVCPSRQPMTPITDLDRFEANLSSILPYRLPHLFSASSPV